MLLYNTHLPTSYILCYMSSKLKWKKKKEKLNTIYKIFYMSVIYVNRMSLMGKMFITIFRHNIINNWLMCTMSFSINVDCTLSMYIQYIGTRYSQLLFIYFVFFSLFVFFFISKSNITLASRKLCCLEWLFMDEFFSYFVLSYILILL